MPGYSQQQQQQYSRNYGNEPSLGWNRMMQSQRSAYQQNQQRGPEWSSGYQQRPNDLRDQRGRQGRRPRGRPKKRWMDRISEDMKIANVTPEDALDRAKWRQCCKRADPAIKRDTTPG
ncbi:XRN2 exoribonuclease, partial [Polypterus senegalus]